MAQQKNLFRLGFITVIIVLLFWPFGNIPPTGAQSSSGIVVDHNSVALFEDIPEEYIQAASNLRMHFIDRSVGGNINDGLTCLGYSSDEAAPSSCKRYEHVDPNFSVSPSEVNWSRPGGYNRDNWSYEFWGDWNPTADCNSWDQKVGCFIDRATTVINQYDVISFQFSYLSVDDGSTIADQPGGFFWDNASRDDVYELETFEAQHADKMFIYWTTSLARPIGTATSEAFNNQMRQYATTNNKALFDVADILSHDPDGNPCYDNRDGIPYDNGNISENYPDDGQEIPAICQHYTTEVDGGHLGSVSAGKIRVAKAFWVLMAQLAGWTPDSNNAPLAVAGMSFDQTIRLTWTVNTTLPATATWRIDYIGPVGDQTPPIGNISNPTRAYNLTGLTNYTFYTVTLSALLDDSPILTDMVTVMPTDIHVYLPLLLK